MSEKVNNIAKNTSLFTLALILQKVISFSYFTILARYLGPESLGKYYFAISFTILFGIIIDIGLSNVLTREVAKNKKEAGNLLSLVLLLKIPLAFIALALTFVVANFSGYDVFIKQLIYISSISVMLDSFTLSFFAVSRGFHNLTYESISSVVFQLIVMIGGISFLELGYDLRYVLAALMFASFFNFSYSFSLLKFKWRIHFFENIDYGLLREVFRLTIPFGLFAIFQRIYVYLDSVLLGILAGDVYVGLYQIPFKIIFSIQFLPMAFTASLYPAMSLYWKTNKEQLSITFERAFNYLLIISLPISFGIIFLADKIVVIFKSGFQEAVLPLIIIISALPFAFLNFPIGSLLNACDKQKINTLNMGFATILSVVLNLFMISKYQVIGASITVVVTNIFMFGFGMYWAPKVTQIRFKKLLLIASKTLSASILMSVFVLYSKSYLNIFIVVFLSAILYFILLFLMKAYNKHDIISIYNSFRKKA